jgi:hypothetical protein
MGFRAFSSVVLLQEEMSLLACTLLPVELGELLVLLTQDASFPGVSG